jgi:hypothetical protein
MSVSNSRYYENKATIEKLQKVARNHFAEVVNESRYKLVSNPWDMKIKTEKTILEISTIRITF